MLEQVAPETLTQHNLPSPRELAFRVSPRTMRMLGRENISSPVISVLELVKNAYDADATQVEIIFEKASTDEGYILIADDGEGMDLKAIETSWMVISTDNKVQSPATPKGRRKVGEKGIGRLAMDRLAQKATVVTHKEGQSGWELELDWSKYEQDTGQLHEISHPLYPAPPRVDGKSGTSLYLTHLRDRWTERDYKALYDDLALLVPPFSGEVNDFVIKFECDEMPQLNGEITNPMAEVAEFTLRSRLTNEGVMHHEAIHRSGRATEEERTWDSVFENARPACGSLQFELQFYLRTAQSLKQTSFRLTELRQFLDRFHGIRIYRDQFRVKPYGDPGGDKDWLGLNARFGRTREGVLSKNTWRLQESQTVGTVFITRQDNPALRDQTNREGLVENTAYRDMRRYLLHAIQFLERERQTYERQKAEEEREKVQTKPVEQTFSDNQKRLTTAAKQIRKLARKSDSARTTDTLQEIAETLEDVTTAQKALQTVYEQEQEERQTEYQLMIGLSTLGIATAAFGHEITENINKVKLYAELFNDTLEQLPQSEQTQAKEDVGGLKRAASRIDAWGKFALDRVRRDKRKRENMAFNKVVQTVLQEFETPFKRDSIHLTTAFADDVPPLRGFIMDIEAIVINFVTNAKEALRKQLADQRHLMVKTEYDQKTHEILLIFADSGTGIAKADLDKIWEPLFSMKVDQDGNPVGTGMGLAIVKNIVDSYNGRIDVQGYGELGGATLTVYLPHTYRKRSKNG